MSQKPYLCRKHTCANNIPVPKTYLSQKHTCAKTYLCQKNGDGDDELVDGANSTSQGLGRDLGEIHGGQASVQTRVNTDQQTT